MDSCTERSPGVGDCRTELVSALHFDPSVEKVVAVAHPHPEDRTPSPGTVLGDDSVLLKFIHPHLLVIATVTPAAAAEPFATLTGAVQHEEGGAVGLETLSATLYVSVIDSVSGKILLRSEIESGVAPVHCVVVENHVVVSYWNTAAKRTELVNLALYEGLVDKNSLVPLANKPAFSKSNLNADGSRTVSSFSMIPPVVQQKNYVLSKHVTSMGVSITGRGISNKHVLLGLSTGQVYALDMRHISPRRPEKPPTNQEKEEVLLSVACVVS